MGVPRIMYPIGYKIGEWTIINPVPTWRIGNHYYWECQCVCGIIREVENSNLKRGITTSCGCIQRKKGAYNYKGVGDLSGRYYHRIMRQALKRGYEFNVTKEYLLSIFTGKCALSGVEIVLSRYGTKTRTNAISNKLIYVPDIQTASLDRIDNDIGYIQGNVQWVHKDINLMKNKFDQDYFVHMCNEISEYNKNID